MGFLGRLLGSPSALKDTVEAVSEGVDRFVYTKGERIEDQQKSITEGRKMVVDWMKTTQGQNLARRIIALCITLVWLLMFISKTSLAVASVWVESDKFRASADIIGENIDQMTGAVMLILGFYFASPYLGQITKTAISKFSKEK